MPNYFHVHLNMLKFMGINISDDSQQKSGLAYKIYSVFFLIFCVYFYIIAEFVNLLEYWGDMENMTFNLCYLVTHFTGMCKATLLLTQSKNIWSYCVKLETGLFLPNKNRGGTDEYEIIRKAVKQCNYQVYIFHFFVVTIVANRGLYAAFDKGETGEYFDVLTNTTQLNLTRVLPYPIWFPFETNSSPNYEIAFVYEIVSCTFYGLLIGTCDALITGFMVHMKAQLLILRGSLRFVHGKTNGNQQNKNGKDDDCKDTWNIRDCIIHHQDILQLAADAEKEFSMLMLAQFCGSLLLMCFQLFQISLYKIQSPKFLSMVTYLCLMLFQLLIYCWNGNEVSVESLEIANAAYSYCDWLGDDLDLQKSLVLLINRAQKPIRISAGGFAYLSLETFTTILRGSSSYYMVLRRMNE